MYYVHGETGTPLYKCWVSMKQRCYNPFDTNFHRYGKRGIEVCSTWVNSFVAFKEWALVNGYKKGLSLDRKDNNGNYNPENCRWTNAKTQNNNSSFNVKLTIEGETKTIAEWIEDERCSAAAQTVYSRLYRGWPPRKAVFMPPRWFRERKGVKHD